MATLRRLNAAECIIALRDGVASTVAELSRVTGLSRPTVEAVLADLQDRELVSVEGASGPSSAAGGRPARHYRFRSEMGYAAGVEAGVRGVRVLLADLSGVIVAERTRNIADGTDGFGRVTLIRAALDDVLASAGLGRHELSAVALGVPGIVAADGRVVASPEIPGWTGAEIGARVGAGFGCPVEIDQEVRLAALAEHRLGAAKIFEDAVYLTAKGPLGAAIIIGSTVHRGRHRAAGVLSPIDSPAPPPDATIDELAARIADLAALLDPDIVVLGGEFGDNHRNGLDRLQALVAADPRLMIPPKIARSELGADAVCLGALLRAFESVSENVYGSAAVPPPLITRVSLSRSAHRKIPVDPRTEEGSQTVLGFDRDMAELRIGVVGVGARAGLAGWAHRREAHAQVVAVADPHPLAAKRARGLFGPAVQVFTDHRALIALAPRLDGVFVTSPDDTHAAIAVDLLNAGIPVYLEKPIAITLEDADRILAAAVSSRTKLYIGHNMRHMSVVTTMADIIRRGEIGEVKAIWCRHFVGNGGDFYFKDWHAERARTGGLLLQKGAHDIDVIHYLAGAYTRDVVGMGDLMMYGAITDRRDNSGSLMPDWFSMANWPPSSQTGLNPVVDVEDVSMMMMRLTNGVLASYEQCHFTPDYWRNYTVIGTHGRLENFGDRSGGTVQVWNRRTRYSPDGDLAYRIVGDESDHDDADAATVAEFLHFIRTGEPTRTSPVAARYAVAAGLAATASLRAGSVPTVVPATSTEVDEYFGRAQAAGSGITAKVPRGGAGATSRTDGAAMAAIHEGKEREPVPGH